jgi:tetratricopeptide (TPR) repeat protein
MLLNAATEMTAPDAMVFGWLARLDIRTRDPKLWWALKSGERLDPNDPWVLYANAEYAASQGDVVREFEFLEKAVAAGLRSRVELRSAYGTMRHSYVLRGERAKADAAYQALVALDPKDAVLRDGHARDLITYLGDFEGGERAAREALAIGDSPHAHETLSLALYAQWAVAARDRRGPQVVETLYRKAQAHDPGAHMIPTCLAEWQPLEFVYTRLAQKNIHAGDMHQC